MRFFKRLVSSSVYLRHLQADSKTATINRSSFKKTKAAKNVLTPAYFLTKELVLLKLS